MTGRKYNEKFAVITFAISFIGFNVLYFPYFFLLDMPRRISTYAASTGWASLNFDATVGAFVFGPAILLTLLNLILSYRKNERCELNPWGAKEMEWTGDYCGSASDPKSMNVSNVTGTNADSLDIPGNSKILERRDIS
jgi:cytochrome c oxidase subunit I+III